MTTPQGQFPSTFGYIGRPGIATTAGNFITSAQALRDQQASPYISASFDGSGNNLTQPAAGASDAFLRRLGDAEYDPVTDIARPNGPNARVVSNALCQGDSEPDADGRNNLVWIWGQFLDHTIALTHTQSGSEAEPLVTPVPSAEEDPLERYPFPGRTVSTTRSKFTKVDGTREYHTEMGSFFSGANVYGFDGVRSQGLRRMDGSGKLKTGLADNGEVILPLNVRGDDSVCMPMDARPGQDPKTMFMAGDRRANEHAALSGIHTAFVREHNFQCDEILKKHPEWSGQDEMIYQHARRMVRGMIQCISMYEWLPTIIGHVPDYSGYQSGVNATLSIDFTTTAFRFGHSMLSEVLQVGANPANTVTLMQIFFNAPYVKTNGVNDILLGQAVTRMQTIDLTIVEAVRSLLFGPPETTHLMDLATINIMRGRDHGVPGYDNLRRAVGLSPVVTFDAMPTTDAIKTKLAELYSSPAEVDPWIGCLAETPLPGKAVGPLMYVILLDQFVRCRDGDRFWFENDASLSLDEKFYIKNNSKLSDILNRQCRVSSDTDRFPSPSFRVPS